VNEKIVFKLTNAFQLSSGASDWLVQRATAVILGSYFLTLTGFLVFSETIDFAVWTGFFNNIFIKIFTMLAVLSAGLHGWIGMWAVGGDYLQEHHFGPIAGPIRRAYLGLCVLLAFAYVALAILIVWGI
jgi:succinate dehydrogenase / fumarate reductase membrane anchor subunit